MTLLAFLAHFPSTVPNNRALAAKNCANCVNYAMSFFFVRCVG